MTVEQLADGVYRLRDGLVNCYLLDDAGEVTIVDTAWPRSWTHLQSAVSEIGRSGSVKAVLLTHGHPDHLGCAEKARSSWGVPVLAHRDEIGRVMGKSKGASPFNLIPHLLPYMWRANTLGFVIHAGARGFMTPRWVKKVEGFDDGAELDLPGRPRVVFTPGHTGGHCSFHLADRGVFIAGDALVTLDPISRQRGPRLLPDPLNVNSRQARESLERLRGIDADLILPGHGEPYNGSLSGAIDSALSPD
jgi:glyoxylase-like metal-dependent hydrolase (beta-lactamase superfamily II)